MQTAAKQKYCAMVLLILCFLTGAVYCVRTKAHYRDINTLCIAAARNDLKTVKKCLEYGVEINGYKQWARKSNDIYTPLTAAIASAGSPEMVNYLIQMGADVNQKSCKTYYCSENPPAYYAAQRGDLKIIEYLAGAGANFFHIETNFYLHGESPPRNLPRVAQDCGHHSAAELIEKIMGRYQKK
jgi:hypothetical protein